MTVYNVNFVEGDPAEIRVRTPHWVRAERAYGAATTKPLEATLFAIHAASGSTEPFDAWLDTVDDWRVKQEDEPSDPPSDPPPATTPD